jgi:di/tricarboxylate transporter
MFTVGILSGYMNSIGVESLFLPVLIDISRCRNQPPSNFLMPLSIAALLGGMTTLIGTPSNILISESLHRFGLRPFQMFDYTPFGMAALFASSLYMIIIEKKLLPRRDIAKELETNDLSNVDAYDLRERMVFLHITEDSHLAGKTLAESRLGSAVG